MIIDKNVTRQVLGAIIQYPQYLGQSDKYKLTPEAEDLTISVSPSNG